MTLSPDVFILATIAVWIVYDTIRALRHERTISKQMEEWGQRWWWVQVLYIAAAVVLFLHFFHGFLMHV